MAVKLDVKLTQLHITMERTRKNIERHCVTLTTIMDSVNEMRLAVKESKIKAKEDMTEITKWNSKIDAQLAEADKEIERLQIWLEERKQNKKGS